MVANAKEVIVPTDEINVAVWIMKPRREEGDSVSLLLSLVVFAANAILVAKEVEADNWGNTEKA